MGTMSQECLGPTHFPQDWFSPASSSMSSVVVSISLMGPCVTAMMYKPSLQRVVSIFKSPNACER